MDADAIPEVVLNQGNVRAVITASGAAVRELRVSGLPLLRSFEPAQRPPGAANIVLAPWPNRVNNATFRFDEEENRLDVTEPELGHALHGFTWGRIFDIDADTSGGAERTDRTDRTDRTEATLRTVLGPEPGWPWTIALTVRYRLVAGEDVEGGGPSCGAAASGAGIEATMTAENIGEEAAPCALGVHTYLDPQGAPLDECTLHHGLTQRQPLDERNIPAGPREPWPDNPIDMAGAWLDDPGFDPEHRTHTAVLVDRAGKGVGLDASISMRWCQLFTSPQRFLAVEPMTAPPNALATGEDLTVLEPGDRTSVHWRVRAI